MKVNLYVADPAHSPAVGVLADLIRRAFASQGTRADRAVAAPEPALQD
jgi:hypothetical protein